MGRSGQRIEHLTHGCDHRHPGEVCHVRHQEISDAGQCARARDRIARNDHRKHHQHRHHHLGNTLHAVAHTGKDDGQRKGREDQKAHLCRQSAGNEIGKITVLRKLTAMAADILRQIADDPAADDRIVRHDQNGNDRIDPAAKPQAALFAKSSKGTHRAFVGHAAQCRFGHDHRVAKGDGQHDVHQQKNAAAVFRGEVRKPPDVAQTHRSACGRQHKADLAGKGAALLFLRIHDLIPLFLYSYTQVALVYHICPSNTTVPPVCVQKNKQRPARERCLFFIRGIRVALRRCCSPAAAAGR